MKLIQINAISRAVDYFETRLQEEATIAEAADISGYSLYHFCRLFNAISRYSPFHYLIKRRICEAARELIKTTKNISRIAFEYEFQSPETFSRAFRRIIGVLPQEWRKTHSLIPQNKLMPAFCRDFLKFINQEDFPEPYVEELPELVLFGLMGTELNSLKKQFQQKPEYLVSWQSKIRKQKLYFAGFEHNPEKDPDFVQKNIPVKQWLILEYSELFDKLDYLKTYLHHIWLANSAYLIDSDLEIISAKSKIGFVKIQIPVKKIG